MPKSKRSKIVPLTNAKSNQKELKEKAFKKLSANFLKFNNVLLLENINLNSENQKTLVNDLPGVLIFAKKTVMRVFFSNQLAAYPQLQTMVEFLENPNLKEVCLLLTNSPKKTIDGALASLKRQEFANPGSPATATVILSAGDQVFQSLSTSNDAYLRNLGVFTTVQDSKLYLQENFVAAQKGKPVTVVQSKIMKMLGIKAGTFESKVLLAFDKSLGTLEVIKQ